MPKDPRQTAPSETGSPSAADPAPADLTPSLSYAERLRRNVEALNAMEDRMAQRLREQGETEAADALLALRHQTAEERLEQERQDERDFEEREREDFEEILKRPFAEVVAQICDGFGVSIDWRAWAEEERMEAGPRPLDRSKFN